MDKRVLELINEMEVKGFNVIKVKPKIRKVVYHGTDGFIYSYIIEFQAPDTTNEVFQNKMS
ncbi:MAG: hypothetical protein ABGX26_02670 [Nautiliaceae bacterium]